MSKFVHIVLVMTVIAFVAVLYGIIAAVPMSLDAPLSGSAGFLREFWPVKPR